mgnify:CR=1 FL=1
MPASISVKNQRFDKTVSGAFCDSFQIRFRNASGRIGAHVDKDCLGQDACTWEKQALISWDSTVSAKRTFYSKSTFEIIEDIRMKKCRYCGKEYK